MKTNVPTHLYFPSHQFQEREYHYTFLTKGMTGEKSVSFDFTSTQIEKCRDTLKPVIKINRSNLLVNNHKPENLIEELVYQSSRAIFPLKLAVNKYGYPIGIHNHPEIMGRWKSFIPQFQSYYERGKAINLLNKIGDIYRNKESFIKKIQHDWFFTAFFFPIYGDYGLGRVSTLEYGFSFTAGAEKKYLIDLEILNELTEHEKVKITLTGTSEIIKNDTVSGYFLLNKDKSIHEVDLVFHLSASDEKISIHIQETKEIAERQPRKHSLVYDEKEEREKLMRSKGIFIEEIESTDLPKHI